MLLRFTILNARLACTPNRSAPKRTSSPLTGALPVSETGTLKWQKQLKLLANGANADLKQDSSIENEAGLDVVRNHVPLATGSLVVLKYIGARLTATAAITNDKN